jgi:hypothetical protein
MKLPFVSKKFVERSAYRALFDPIDTGKRAPRWHKRERIKPRKPRTLADAYMEKLKRLDVQALREQEVPLQDPIDAGTDLPEGRAPLVKVKTPWYKKKKLT